MSAFVLLQWKFTACQYNIEGSNGFNTFSMSEGLTADDKADLCRRAGTYTPQEGLPFKPTPEEMGRFPKVFSSFPLRSGKHAVVRTVYVGQDYGGMRWGNFLSHALILPADSCPLYPIQLFDSPLFANGLTEEERTTPNPPPLPTVEVDETSLRDFSEELSRFFTADASRVDALIPFLNAVREGHPTGKPLILRDVPENIPLWLAAVQYAFPFPVARGITFTTYVHSLSHGERFHITAASDNKTLQTDSPATRSTNHLFDLTHQGRCIPTIAVKDSIYIKTIVPTLPPYPGKNMREKIQPFLQDLRCELTGDSLENGLLLYQFLQSNTDRAEPKELQGMLGFLMQQSDSIQQDIVLKILRKEQNYRAETLEALLPVLVKIIAKSNNGEHLKLFRNFFVKQFRNSVEPFDWENGDRRFKMLDRLLNDYGDVKNIRKIVFDLTQHLMKQTGECKKYVFLYYALCLSDTASFSVSIEALPELEKDELEHFFGLALDYTVSKSTLVEIHQHTIGLFTKKSGYDAGFARRYLQLVKKSGGTEQWKAGNPAREQGTAFVQYLFRVSSFNEWLMWIGKDFHVPHRSLLAKSFQPNQLWTLFDVGDLHRAASALEKKKRWEYILNIRKIFKALMPPSFSAKERKAKLRIIGLPTWWGIWGTTVIISIGAVIMIAAIGVSMFLSIGG